MIAWVWPLVLGYVTLTLFAIPPRGYRQRTPTRALRARRFVTPLLLVLLVLAATATIVSAQGNGRHGHVDQLAPAFDHLEASTR